MPATRRDSIKATIQQKGTREAEIQPSYRVLKLAAAEFLANTRQQCKIVRMVGEVETVWVEKPLDVLANAGNTKGQHQSHRPAKRDS